MDSENKVGLFLDDLSTFISVFNFLCVYMRYPLAFILTTTTATNAVEKTRLAKKFSNMETIENALF